jgi:hypothetical protein
MLLVYRLQPVFSGPPEGGTPTVANPEQPFAVKNVAGVRHFV